ncbi:glycosyltransferase family 4 protein [Rhodoplanes roseus]|uniref:Glycosyl transferase family 1 domain-containing protein n=1 Tax=Rhodoplanes roseus TaxID=29409 RepID=A0A327KIY8_9BRAD|nr:glycosyltransferase family 4 protein [Rhodoplanes roseus]RAI38086.1 hypothetical protein CH341_28480 [Rhodoplanes roseus]
MTTLRYVGWSDRTGYGTAATELVRALDAAGVSVAWEPVLSRPGYLTVPAPERPVGSAWRDLERLRDLDRVCDRVVLHLVPEYYPALLARERARGDAPVWGCTVWETDRLPGHWPALLNRLDGVIVPTEWNREVFRASGVRVPIVVVPHVRPSFDGPASAEDRARLDARLPDLAGRRVFYTISTWLERKGIAPLIEAFTAAFRHSDPVALIVKTTADDLERTRPPRRKRPYPVALPVRPQLARMVRRATMRQWRRPPPIVLVTDDLSDGELRALHDRGDCYVSLSRGEGWGLGAFEAALLGKAVIVTGWGGYTAFVTPDTGYLVDWTLVPVRPAVPNASYTPDQSWAEPSVASAAAALRAVVESPDEAARRGARARTDLRVRFDARAVAAGLRAALWP